MLILPFLYLIKTISETDPTVAFLILPFLNLIQLFLNLILPFLKLILPISNLILPFLNLILPFLNLILLFHCSWIWSYCSTVPESDPTIHRSWIWSYRFWIWSYCSTVPESDPTVPLFLNLILLFHFSWIWSYCSTVPEAAWYYRRWSWWWGFTSWEFTLPQNCCNKQTKENRQCIKGLYTSMYKRTIYVNV